MVIIKNGPVPTVRLRVTGDSSLVKKPFDTIARQDDTWFEFLTRCGLKISSMSQFKVESAPNNRFTQIFGRPTVSARLDQKVREFIGNYEHTKYSYVVRVRKTGPVTSKPGRGTAEKNQGSSLKVPSNSPLKRQLGVRAKGNPSINIYQKPRYTPKSCAGRNGIGPGKILYYRTRRSGGKPEAEDMDGKETAPSVRTKEKKHGPSGAGSLKSKAEQTFKEFSNPFLLAVKTEVENLKRKRVWKKCMQQTPLCCQLVEKLVSQ